MGFVSILFVMLLDPIRVVLGLIGGVVARSWPEKLIAAGVVAGVVDLILSSTQVAREFSLLNLFLGFCASLVFVLLGEQLKRFKSFVSKKEATLYEDGKE